jgi:hypothetical protein
MAVVRLCCLRPLFSLFPGVNNYFVGKEKSWSRQAKKEKRQNKK